MGAKNRGNDPGACFVCGSSDSGTIEFDRPVILLCECRGCGKFVLTYGTREALMEEPDFDRCRESLSRVIRKHFNTHGRPLEIILERETSRTPFAVTVAQLMKLARTDNF